MDIHVRVHAHVHAQTALTGASKKSAQDGNLAKKRRRQVNTLPRRVAAPHAIDASGAPIWLLL